MMKEFERLLNILQVFKKTLSEEDWSRRCKEIKIKEVSFVLFFHNLCKEIITYSN